MSEPTILVPLDGSEHALGALPVAKVFAEIEGAMLRLIHVAERKLPPMELERLGLDPAAIRGATVDARTGEPAAAILGAAEEMKARLIVMCTHTAPATPGQTLGSTAAEVLRAAPCPVVLVRPGADRYGWSLHRFCFRTTGTPPPAPPYDRLRSWRGGLAPNWWCFTSQPRAPLLQRSAAPHHALLSRPAAA